MGSKHQAESMPRHSNRVPNYMTVIGSRETFLSCTCKMYKSNYSCRWRCIYQSDRNRSTICCYWVQCLLFPVKMTDDTVKGFHIWYPYIFEISTLYADLLLNFKTLEPEGLYKTSILLSGSNDSQYQHLFKASNLPPQKRNAVCQPWYGWIDMHIRITAKRITGFGKDVLAACL